MLTAAQVQNARAKDRDYMLFDSGGLYLYVTRKGARSWRFKYAFAGKERRMTFGLFPDVTLAAARARRDAARALLLAGKDPLVEAEKAKVAATIAAGMTLQKVGEEWLEDQRPHWSAAHAKRVRLRLEKDIYPALGKFPIAEITGRMVLVQLRKIEARGSIETAKRVRAYVEAIFKRAKGERYVNAGAVLEVSEIADALKRTPRGSKQPALTTLPELLEFQRAVDRSTSATATKLASRLLALTVVRIGVLRTARWDEFEGIDWENLDADSSAAIWRISAARMKLDVEDKGNEAFGHDVPLPPAAVEVLRALRLISGRYELVFPGGKTWRVAMSDAAVSTMYKRLAGGRYKGRMVPHGWRAAFSTIMNERAARLKQDTDRAVIDMMLAHVPEGTSASEWAYNRARYIDSRRELGEVWADLITKEQPSPMTLVTLEPVLKPEPVRAVWAKVTLH